MDRAEEIRLLETLLNLRQNKQRFLDEHPRSNPVADYHDAAHFELERTRLLARLPVVAAHVSELPEPNAFVRRDLHGRPLVIMRGDDGEIRGFLNVCRHRGTRLVDAEQGCKRRFPCPYHAWTWDSRGQFVGAPHFDEGFPNLERDTLGLHAVDCVEHGGLIWVMPNAAGSDIETHLAGLGSELAWAGIDQLVVHDIETQSRRCNWKLLVEGGIEAYHFKVAHRNTIGSLFNDTLSSYEMFGDHFRSILPRASIVELADQPRDQWRIRDHANVLYTLFPGSSLLVQSDHVVWVHQVPVSADQTTVRVVTLRPPDSERADAYWDKNHELTVQTLNEDFDLAESIQSGLTSGANEHLHFGRFEGALFAFNEAVRRHLSSNA